jgi:predicted dehydrogenase
MYKILYAMNRRFLLFPMLASLLVLGPVVFAQPLRVAIAGLNHDHVRGILQRFRQGGVIILGIAEADTRLVAQYKKQYQLADSLFYPDLRSMLAKVNPEAVLAYNPISEHLAVVEACAPRRISVMVEKPLATTVADAERMKGLADQYHIHLLTNYETSWYPSNYQVYTLIHREGSGGPIRKMIVHSGHQGPREIGCSPEFLRWLTDPVKNGGGAIMDFGCYGANLMTWLMDGRAPLSVSALARHMKPDIYPKVDDDATILLEYPSATGIIEASWNWPFGIKDLEVFGQSTYLHALNANTILQRDSNQYNPLKIAAPPYTDNVSYLSDVLRGVIHPEGDLSSLENNLIVVRILEAARTSAREGRRVKL